MKEIRRFIRRILKESKHGIMFKLPNSSTVIEVNYMGQIECK